MPAVQQMRLENGNFIFWRRGFIPWEEAGWRKRTTSLKLGRPCAVIFQCNHTASSCGCAHTVRHHWLLTHFLCFCFPLETGDDRFYLQDWVKKVQLQMLESSNFSNVQSQKPTLGVCPQSPCCCQTTDCMWVRLP